MFYIRADANEVIATGHVMRCLSIADAMRKRGEEVTFFVADERGEKMIADRGYTPVCLHSVWNHMESELGALISYIDQYHVQTLLVDSYQVTQRYLETLREYVKVLYIDDLDAFTYPCDRIINYAVYAEECSYAKKEGNLIGMDYVPLRQVFWDLPRRIVNKQAKRILVLTGGTDEPGFMRKFLEEYLAWDMEKNFFVTAVCGRFQKDYEELLCIASCRANITVVRDVSNIEWYMQQADVAVSAGGTALYELCACGTPTLSYTLAENQMKNVLAFDKMELIPYCGDAGREDCVAQILERIGRWRMSADERGTRAVRMQRLIDGKGAIRLARELLTTEIQKIG